jgi:hypothetical protein
MKSVPHLMIYACIIQNSIPSYSCAGYRRLLSLPTADKIRGGLRGSPPFDMFAALLECDRRQWSRLGRGFSSPRKGREGVTTAIAVGTVRRPPAPSYLSDHFPANLQSPVSAILRYR